MRSPRNNHVLSVSVAGEQQGRALSVNKGIEIQFASHASASVAVHLRLYLDRATWFFSASHQVQCMKPLVVYRGSSTWIFRFGYDVQGVRCWINDRSAGNSNIRRQVATTYVVAGDPGLP